MCHADDEAVLGLIEGSAPGPTIGDLQHLPRLGVFVDLHLHRVHSLDSLLNLALAWRVRACACACAPVSMSACVRFIYVQLEQGGPRIVRLREPARDRLTQFYLLLNIVPVVNAHSNRGIS